MADALGRRRKFAVVAPSTNTVVQPEFDAMRPPGVTNHLRDAVLAVDGTDVEAVIQVGANLAMARLAGIAEFWLGKPVLAINTATYWWALRRNGIADPIDGFGSLLREH